MDFHQREVDDPVLTDLGRAYFKKLESGDPQMRALWQKLVTLSLEDFNQLYRVLNVRFDMQLAESFYEPMLSAVLAECLKSGVARVSEGATLVFFPDESGLPPLMLQKSNGSSLYGLRDLAGIKYRLSTYKLDKLIIEIGNEQKMYFQQVISASEMLGYSMPGQIVHVGHGLFMLPSGKMSTRRGETVWLKDLIGEVTQQALAIVNQKSPQIESIEKLSIAEKVAIGALKYNDLSQNRLSNIVFDKEKSLSLEGNSAPYIQYTIARARSVLRVAREKSLDVPEIGQNVELLSLAAEERSLILWLARFEEHVDQAAQHYLPNILTTYLFQLAQKYNAFYHTQPIIQASTDLRHRRLSFTLAAIHTLVTGLDLLGIEAPERM